MRRLILHRIKNRLRLFGPLARLRRDRARVRAASLLKAVAVSPERLVVTFDLTSAFPGALTHGRLFALEEFDRLEAVVVDRERLADVEPRLLRLLREDFSATPLGDPFVLFLRGAAGSAGAPGRIDADLVERIREMESPESRGYSPHRPKPSRVPPPGRSTAIAITTFERPAALARSLPSIMALGAPVLVVDDGSRDDLAEANRALCGRHAVRYLRLPDNRGLPTAMNIAIGYWLADPEVEWISYLQDDVEVDPRLLDVLRAIENPSSAPLLTGFDAADHPSVETRVVEGRPVKMKRTTPAVHLHAHRAYWAAVMPIPSPYVGAPKVLRGASMEDWWITSHAPNSVEQRGLTIPCVPDLVTTFLWHRDDSTWGNPSIPRS